MKKPIALILGILCTIFAIIDILAGKDAFITLIALLAAVVNLVVAFIGED